MHPDDVSPRQLLLGTFVEHNAQVLVAGSENQQECKNVVLMSQSELVCLRVFCVCESICSFMCVDVCVLMRLSFQESVLYFICFF